MSQPAPEEVRAARVAWRAAADRGGLVIVLVRHGQTSWNRERRFLGRTDLPLDEEGHAQAQQLAAALGVGAFDAVYTSPLTRAVQTARALHPDPQRLPGVAEMHQGELEGLLAPEAMARFPAFFAAWDVDPGDVPAPGGESLIACRTRALAALADLPSAHRPGEVIAVISHQLVIASVSCTAAGESLRSWRRFGVPNVGLRVLEFNGETLTIVR